MILFGGKQFRRALAGYLILVITGASAFLMTTNPELSEFAAKQRAPDAALAPMEVTLDWLTEGAVVPGKDEGYSPHSLRSGTPRLFAASGIQGAGIALVQSNCATIKNAPHRDMRSAILLKLRI